MLDLELLSTWKFAYLYFVLIQTETISLILHVALFAGGFNGVDNYALIKFNGVVLNLWGSNLLNLC